MSIETNNEGITTMSIGEELLNLKNEILMNRKQQEEKEEDPIQPNVLASKIIFIHEKTKEKEDQKYRFKEKGHSYDISLGQQKEDYKTTIVIYDQIIEYDFITQTDRDTGLKTIKITRNENRNEPVCMLRQKPGEEIYEIEIQNETYMNEADTIIDELYNLLQEPAQ